MDTLKDIPVEKLLLDAKNPRIYKTIPENITQIELASYLYDEFGISDLTDSILKHGYFPVEPMVAIPSNDGSDSYIVVEGNRRLTTIKILCFDDYRNDAVSLGRREDYRASDELKIRLATIPVVIANNREDVDAYLGVRHLRGVKPWGALAQSKYVYNQIVKKKLQMDSTVQGAISAYITETSNRKSDVISHFYKFSIYKNMQRIVDADPLLKADFENKFSYFDVALGKTGRTSISEYIGIGSYNRLDPENYEDIIPEEYEPQVKNFIKWVFTENAPIAESREIGRYLKPILRNEASTIAFENGEDKESALLLSGTYEDIIRKSCQSVHKSLTDIINNWSKIDPDIREDLIKDYRFKVLEKVIQANNTIGVQNNE